MKSLIQIAIVSLVAAPSLIQAASLDSWRLSNEFAVDINGVSGPGSANAAITDGSNFFEAVNFNGKGDLRGFDYDVNLGVKWTDDRRRDLKNFSLTKLSGRLSNGDHTATLGDVFESFSRYSMNTSIKGVGYRFSAPKTSKAPNVSLIWGVAYPRWDNFYGDSLVKTIRRSVVGGRAWKRLHPDFQLGLQTTVSRDSDRVSASDDLLDNNNYAFDWGWTPIAGLKVDGESSWAQTDTEASAGAAVVGTSGSAHRVTAVGQGGSSKVTVEVESIGTEFVSTLGAATPDRRKLKTKWRFKKSKTLSFHSSLLYFRNNLDGSRTSTTHNVRPDFKATWRKLGGRRYASTDLGWRWVRRYGGNRSQADHYLTAAHRDRFYGLDSNTNLALTAFNTKANVADTNEIQFNQVVSTRKSTEDYIFKPQVAFGWWNSSDELANTTDKLFEASAGTGFEMPDWNLNADLRFGASKLSREAGEDASKGFVSANAFYRPEKLREYGDPSFFLRFAWNKFGFTTASRDFRQTGLTIGVNSHF